MFCKATFGVIGYPVWIDAAFAPDIPLVHVMVVRQTNGWSVSHQVAERPAQQVPFAQVVQRCATDGRCVGRIGWSSDDAVSTDRFVDLVAREEQYIGILCVDISNDRVVGEEIILVPRESCDDERSTGRLGPNRTGVACGPVPHGEL